MMWTQWGYVECVNTKTKKIGKIDCLQVWAVWARNWRAKEITDGTKMATMWQKLISVERPKYFRIRNIFNTFRCLSLKVKRKLGRCRLWSRPLSNPVDCCLHSYSGRKGGTPIWFKMVCNAEMVRWEIYLFVGDVVAVLLICTRPRHPWEKLISLKQLSQLSSLCIQRWSGVLLECVVFKLMPVLSIWLVCGLNWI